MSASTAGSKTKAARSSTARSAWRYRAAPTEGDFLRRRPHDDLDLRTSFAEALAVIFEQFRDNWPASRPSHEGAVARRAVELVRRGGFEQVRLRGDTDFSLTNRSFVRGRSTVARTSVQKLRTRIINASNEANIARFYACGRNCRHNKQMPFEQLECQRELSRCRISLRRLGRDQSSGALSV